MLVLVLHPDGPAAQALLELAAGPAVRDVSMFIFDAAPTAPAADPTATAADGGEGDEAAAMETRGRHGAGFGTAMAFMFVLMTGAGVFGVLWLSCWLAVKYSGGSGGV